MRLMCMLSLFLFQFSIAESLKCIDGTIVSSASGCPSYLDEKNAIFCDVSTHSLQIIAGKNELIENTSPIYANCKYGNLKSPAAVTLDAEWDYSVKINVSYKSKTGVLVKESSHYLKLSELQKGFSKTNVYQKLMADGAIEIKLASLWIPKNEKIKINVIGGVNTCVASDCKNTEKPNNENVIYAVPPAERKSRR